MMKQKLLLQDIIDKVFDSSDLTKSEAESFVRKFFDTIEKGLIEDHVVKINNLGVFKLVLVKARRSVDVNTGNEVEIKEHYKISFIPGPDFKEFVNKPFSNLNSVILDSDKENNLEGDNYSFSEDDDEDDNHSISQDYSNTDAGNANLKGSEEDNPYNKEEPDTESFKYNNSLEDDFEDYYDKDDDDDVEKDENDSEKRGSFPSGFIKFFLLAALVAAFFLWRNRYDDENKDLKEKLDLMRDLDLKAGNEEKYYEVPYSENETYSEVVADVEDKKVQNESVNLTDSSSVNSSDSVKTSLPKEEKLAGGGQDEKNIKKNVNNNITVIKTVTSRHKEISYPVKIKFKKGETLANISNEYYGARVFWVYIYMDNKTKIKDLNAMPVGTIITVNSPDSSKINSNDINCIEKAQKLQNQILGEKD